MSPLRIYIDFKSGPAYLAMKPTLALLEQKGIAADWLPFDSRLPQAKPAREGESRGETHLRVRQEQRRLTCLKYAAIQGIPMHYAGHPSGTRCALAAMLHARPNPLRFIEAAFIAYWRDNRDLDDAAVVTGLLRQADYAADSFDPEAYMAELDANQQEAEERGVFDTPMYQVGQEMFLGREQLPWIAALL